ncbi:MAG: hypothetical protein DI596_11935 [Azospira oryzae]|nr:MAG: hypothetical protein DI596_11935 [Azospira oryzae]PZP77702.1 MAG: hypothetical protein DI593_11935 [Azospira oryzae]
MKATSDRDVSMARMMARLGARASTISSNTGLSIVAARRIYFNETGRRPPPGQHPSSYEWLDSPVARVHSSLYLSLFEPRYRAGLDVCQAAVLAYADYMHAVEPEIELDFERAFFVSKLLICSVGKSGRDGFQRRPCVRCGALYYVGQPQAARRQYVCPVCTGRAAAALAIRRRKN